MNINEELLKKEIKELENKLIKNYGKKDKLYEYLKLITYDEILKDISGTSTNVEKRVMTKSLYDEIDKVQHKLSMNVCNFYNENQFLISDGFNSCKKIFNSDPFLMYPRAINVYKMQEREIIDILLSYFSLYGDRIYKIVKRYLDEGRVELGSSIVETNPAFFIESNCLKSGYITAEKTGPLNISNLSVLAHEFGHVIDSETFLFPQNKKLHEYDDILAEVPSIFFEIGLLKYMINNKIYEKDAHLMMIDIYSSLMSMLNDFDVLRAEQQPIIDDSGYLINDEGYLIGTDGKALKFDSDEDYYSRNAINVVDTLKYSLGIYLGLNMNILSQNDEKEYLKKVLNFTTSRKEYSLDELIQMLGITTNQFQNASIIKQPVEKEIKLIKKMLNYYS